MDVTKIIGWLTFIGGIAIIVFTLYSSYNIFTGKTPVPEFFKTEKGIEINETPQGGLPTSAEELQQQLGQMINEQLKGILPMESLNKIFNLGIWSILAGILIFGGSQIAGLGIRLLK